MERCIFASNKGNESNTDHDMYKSEYVDGEFQEAKRLPGDVNTKAYEADVFVSPDESYIIYCATKRSGLGRGDLYVSFRDEDGLWSRGINLGAPVNTEGHELCPFVTADGRFLLYTSNEDIYWVSAEVVYRLRSE